MVRAQVLLEPREFSVLKAKSSQTGKSLSELVRLAVDTVYLSRFSDREISAFARDAKAGKGMKKFSRLEPALKHLWSL